MPSADLILYNAKVITLDPERPNAELVAVKGNRILAVGDKNDLDLFKGAGTRLSDCDGGTIIPGFNDAHCHPLSHAASLLGVDCSPRAVGNIAEIQAAIKGRAERVEAGKWVRAAGYDEFSLEEKRPPNRRELDLVSPGRPVILTHATAGKCVLNSPALQLAGINRDTPEPSGGQIHRDSKTGEPNGLISGRNEQVENAIPQLDEDELEEGMKLADQEYLSHGITSLQDTSWNNGSHHWRIWQEYIDREIVSPRVSMLIGTESLDTFVRMGLSTGCGNDRLSVGGLKLALDESTGCPHPPQDEVNRHALRACEAGFQIAFHVGDVHMLYSSLEAIRFVLQQTQVTEPRFRLEHCSVCPPDALLKVKASGAIVVTQPSFLYFLGERNREEVLPHQTGWLWPFGSFRRWGLKTAFSSDSPLVNSNPLTGIYAAVTRNTEIGRKLAPQERILPLDALELYTLSGAYASFQEEVKGSIRPGKFADLAVLNGDPTGGAPEQLRDLKVIRTVIDGKVVWER